MAGRELAFCDGKLLYFWLIQRLAGSSGGRRRVRTEIGDATQPIVDAIEDLRRAGIKIATTLADAGDILTRLYKRESPFVGDSSTFLVRKSLAYEVGRSLSDLVILLSPQDVHFQTAFALWYELCEKDNKDSFAGFSDYLDAALILSPAEKDVVRHVLVDHKHLQFILNKRRTSAIVQIHRVPDFGSR